MTASDRILDLTIIGSGIAGLAVAHAARETGLTCMILDKGRRVGGRVSTKRSGGFTFNRGVLVGLIAIGKI